MMRILLVCLGNICRSPTAHGIFQKKIDQAGLSVQVGLDSAGTAGWHIGKTPDSRAISAATGRGYDLTGLWARQVQVEDFQTFDLILAMDESNRHDLLALCPEGYQSRVKLFLDFSGVDGETEVPDPYYGGEQGFQSVIDLIEKAVDNLVTRIKDGSL